MERDIVPLTPHMGEIHRAHRIGDIAAGGHERHKIVFSHKVLRRAFHPAGIQRPWETPAQPVLKRVRHGAVMNAVDIFFAFRTVTGVEILRHPVRLRHSYIVRQKAVDGKRKLARRKDVYKRQVRGLLRRCSRGQAHGQR